MKHNKLVLSTLFSGVLFSGIVLAADGKAAWDYEAPANWGNLSPDYASCNRGKSQSPIDIKTSKTAKLADIKFSYSPAPIDVLNNGHTIQMNYAKGSTINLGGKIYQLLQLHFHSPSEHLVNGKAYNMVAHLVHQAADGQLGVIGIMMKVGKANPVIASIWNHMPKKTGEHNKTQDMINVANLLPANHSYFNYSGSLTTPPCSEGVNWMVLQTPVEVSAEQVASFTGIFAKSVRPVQEINSRIIHATK